jgi:hypothetical protein
MTSIRLIYEFSYDHAEIPAGTVIAVPAGLARDFINRGIAEAVEPERAVIEPQETRLSKKHNYKRG